ESLVLVFACVALVPMLVQIVDRLRAARGVLAEIERGDLRRQIDSAAPDTATDELGFLSVSVNRMTASIADIIREIGRQGGALARRWRAVSRPPHGTCRPPPRRFPARHCSSRKGPSGSGS